MFGLTLYGIGALMMWPAALKRSFGGFCGATFIIGSGLGSLETAANPYLTGMPLVRISPSCAKSILTCVCSSLWSTTLRRAPYQFRPSLQCYWHHHRARPGVLCVLQDHPGFRQRVEECPMGLSSHCDLRLRPSFRLFHLSYPRSHRRRYAISSR